MAQLFDRMNTGYPYSRDFGLDEVACKKIDCVANVGAMCISPACIKIGENGECLGYKKKPTQEALAKGGGE